MNPSIGMAIEICSAINGPLYCEQKNKKKNKYIRYDLNLIRSEVYLLD